MYAIAFDLLIGDLKEHYGEPYNNAYFEIKEVLKSVGFEWTQGRVYISASTENNLTQVYKAINILSKIDWFKKSVRDIRAFKVESSNDIIKYRNYKYEFCSNS